MPKNMALTPCLLLVFALALSSRAESLEDGERHVGEVQSLQRHNRNPLSFWGHLVSSIFHTADIMHTVHNAACPECTQICPSRCRCERDKMHCQHRNMMAIPAMSNNYLPRIETIYLGNNFLETIEGNGFWGWPNLRTLRLQNNKITRISPNAFDGNPYLEELNLYNNELESIPDGIQVNSLNVLILGENPLSNLPLEILKRAKHLTELSLVGNNDLLDCDLVENISELGIAKLRLPERCVTVATTSALPQTTTQTPLTTTATQTTTAATIIETTTKNPVTHTTTEKIPAEDPESDPCLRQNHEVARDQHWRAVGFDPQPTIDILRDDNHLRTGWYRFESAAGREIPEFCPIPDEWAFTKGACGTWGPVWMTDTHPTLAEGIVEKVVCERSADAANCCVKSWKIRVKNCLGFYVYFLTPTQQSLSAYCVGTETPCQVGFTSSNGFSPNCKKDPCQPDPCPESSTCVGSRNSYVCIDCPAGFTGPLCEIFVATPTTPGVVTPPTQLPTTTATVAPTTTTQILTTQQTIQWGPAIVCAWTDGIPASHIPSATTVLTVRSAYLTKCKQMCMAKSECKSFLFNPRKSTCALKSQSTQDADVQLVQNLAQLADISFYELTCLPGLSPCSNPQISYYPDQTQCQFFHQCAHGFYDYLMSCPNGLHWSQNYLQCLTPQQANCQIPSNSDTSADISSVVV